MPIFQEINEKADSSVQQRSYPATLGISSAGGSSTYSRLPYQTAHLANSVNVNSLQQHREHMLNRTDRRALGVTPAYNGGSLKHRLGPRRTVTKATNVLGTDVEWRPNYEEARLYGQVFDTRSDSQASAGAKLRSFSANGAKLHDSPNGARANPRGANTNVPGSHGSNVSSSGGTPYNVSQQYACSAFPYPNVTKVTPHQPASFGLSVISGPAPIMNRPDGTVGDHGLPPRKPSNGLGNPGR